MIILFHCLDTDLSAPFFRVQCLLEGGKARIRNHAGRCERLASHFAAGAVVWLLVVREYKQNKSVKKK